MHPRNRILSVAVPALLSLAMGAATRADDTEIFVATPTVAIRPNVMIIIDTSLSMDTMVSVRPPFDPAGSYSGSCAEDRVYWKTASSGTTPPVCSGTSATTQWVSRSNFLCKTIFDDLDTLGRKGMKYVAQWSDVSPGTNNDKWQELKANRDSLVECRADNALHHGRIDDDRLVPANAANGPFASDVNGDLINWNSSTAGSATNTSYNFYTGKYLNYLSSTPVTATRSRIDIVKDAAKRVIDSSALDGTNVAIMAFNSKDYSGPKVTLPISGADDRHRGGMVLHQFAPIETSRASLKAVIGNPSDAVGGETGMFADSYTPLSETLFEAYRYFSGGAVYYGKDSEPSPSVAASYSGSNYNNPITSSCITNYIFYLTDGGPTDDMEAEPVILALPDYNTVLGRTGTAMCTVIDGQSTSDALATEVGDGRCLDDLAEYMYKKDFYDDPALSANDEVIESVRTFTISFGDSVPVTAQLLLEDTANRAGGQNFIATDPVSLEEAFESAAANITSDAVSFTAPTVSVNAFNRTRTLNDLFFTVFEPARTFHWPGNLKKYRIDTDGTIMAANNVPAVEPTSGFFAEGSQSYWSDAVDGPTVTKGGAAHELQSPAARNVYTDVAAFLASPNTNKNLSANANKLVDGNANVTAALLGLPGTATATDRTDLINWARGADAYNTDVTQRTNQRSEMGDPLHARPVSVIYGGTATAPEAVVFVATNDGYLHAIDPNGASNSAQELWTYVPSELLNRMNSLRSTANSSSKQYALDGNLSVYKVDVDNDGVIESADGDKVWLFFGMGRGGRNVYALDVTNKTAPVFKWRKGSGDTGMSGVGYTWSTPIPTQVSIDPGSGTPVTREVVIFAGGYDPAQDGGTTPSTQANFRRDSIGNGVYMLNADDGTLLWRAGETTGNLVLANMQHSMPADVRVIDLTGDGLADRMYASDTGARVWRFDIINGSTATNLVRGGVFASLGVASGIGSSPADARRFYSTPDVSVLRADNVSYLNITIGSGFRGHPLNTAVSDRFYSMRDPIPFRPMTAAEYTAMTADPIVDDPSATPPDLVNVTTTTGTPTIPATARGWKINLAAGEKVLVDSQTFAGASLFSTFTPSGNTVRNACSAHSGTNRLYAVLAANGRAFADRDNDGNFETEDRSAELEQQGIAPSAVILFPTPDPTCTGQACSPPPVCLVGPESCGVSFTNDPVKTFWMQKEVD